MTFWEFLYNASFWQWFGLLLLVSAFAQAIGNLILLIGCGVRNNERK